MKIAQLAPPLESVPPAGYGGTERVVHVLTEQLVAAGYDVTLFASGDSKTSATLVPVCDAALRPAGVMDPMPHIYGALQMAYDRAGEFDLIHSHLEYLAFPFARAASTPTVHTMHGRLDLPGYEAVYGEFREQPLVSISNSQRKPLPEQNWAATIYHGLSRETYTLGAGGDYLLFVGRFSPEKRADWAIEIAERAGIKLILAAKIDPAERDYYESVIEPLLKKSRYAEYIGEVGDDEKNALYGGALGLVMPIDWPEPFGLTAIEAMACGTPVLTRPRGALPELITPGVTGFVEEDIARLAEHCDELRSLDRAKCRAEFEERFSDEAMARDYVLTYRRLIDEATAAKVAAVSADERPEDDQWVTTTLSSPLPKHVYKDNQAFVVTDHAANITCEAGGELGFFRRGTRHLSRLELRLNDVAPLVLFAASRPESGDIVVDLGNEQFTIGDDVIVRNSIHLRRTTSIENDILQQGITISSFETRPLSFELTLELDCDFADIFEVRGVPRERRGSFLGFTHHSYGGEFAYMGVDGVERRTRVDSDPLPTECEGSRLRWTISLSPRGSAEIRLTAKGYEVNTAAAPFALPPRTSKAGEKNSLWIGQTPEIVTNDSRVDATLQQAVVDLGQLMSWGVDGLYPCAGVPWYSTIFGRDSIITALQLLPWRPDVAAATLRTLAHFQGDRFDDFTDAEPGKILHEWREGEMANTREIPFIPYFGTVDATPLFLRLLAATSRVTGNGRIVEELWSNALRAVEWMEATIDASPHKLLSYAARNPKGLRNQGWKDSADSISHRDGRLAEPAISLVEVQGYAVLAFSEMAALARQRNDEALAARCERRATELTRRIHEDFWMPGERTFGLALDRDGELCHVVSSNAGHLLITPAVDGERARNVAQRSLQRDMDSGFGIRTLSSGEARYNPMSYHNGSIWPHDNLIISEGMRRHGMLEEMSRVHRELLAAVFTFPLRRPPELWCGFDRQQVSSPVPYPTACAPQAWASGSMLMLIAQALGLELHGAEEKVVLRQPTLPEPIEWIEVRALRFGGAELDLRAERKGDRTVVDVLRQSGTVEVVVEEEALAAV